MVLSKAAITKAPSPGTEISSLARQIIDAIRKNTSVSRQEQTRQLTLVEQALTIIQNSEKRIVDLEDHIDRLESISRTDFLTGIANRRGFDNHLHSVLADADRHGDTGVLVLIDLDHFKDINDTHGHEAGDMILRQVAKCLSTNVRLSDFVARLGGDEFAIVLSHTGPAEGIYRSRRLLTALEQITVKHEHHTLRIQASIGVANYNSTASAKNLLHRADIAMYRHKRSKGLRFTRLAG